MVPELRDRCPVCGNALKPGEGIPAEWNGQVIRFRCLGCLARFEADPARYLAGNTEPCRAEESDQVAIHTASGTEPLRRPVLDSPRG